MSLKLNNIIISDMDFIAQSSLSWKVLQNKTIMVTGGGGFIGSYLIKSLLHINKKHNLDLSVICVARKIDSVNHRLIEYLKEKNFKVILHDISNPLPNNFPNANFIIHAASQASPKFYGVDPIGTLSANSLGTLNLLNHALKIKSEKFLFISSAEVYGDPVNPDLSISEKDYGYLDPINIRSCYAESKRIGETMTVAWGNQHNIYTSIVRPFHTYGPGLSFNDGRVFADFVSDIVNNQNITLKSDGSAKRTFCYIRDTVSGILTVLLTGKKNEAYNIGNPDTEIAIKDLATILVNLFPQKQLKVKFEIETQNMNYLKSPISHICPSIEKLKKLGWTPLVDIKEGFTRTIESYQ